MATLVSPRKVSKGFVDHFPSAYGVILFRRRTSCFPSQYFDLSRVCRPASIMSKPGQYDESPELIRAIQDRMREKTARKALYNKMMSDPYRWAFEAAPVDMGILRFEAQKTMLGSYKFFKPNVLTFTWHLCSVWIPIIGFTLAAEKYKKDNERKIRSGQVAYRDKYSIFAN